MAERKGFEPSKAYTLHAFQACSFNHSDTSLKFIKILRFKISLIDSAFKWANFATTQTTSMNLNSV